MVQYEVIAYGILAGIAFGIVGFVTKRDEGEPFNLRKLVRTTAIYGAAGALVATQGESITQGNIAAATGSTVIVGELADRIYSKAAKLYRARTE